MAERLDVAIVGAGPAGLGAAMALKAAGIDRITVLEREAEPGGVPRHCAHPPYGLHEYRRLMAGPAYARRIVADALAVGIEIRCRTTVVSLREGGRLDLATPDGSGRIEARRVLLATGIRETPRSARLVGGSRPAGVLNTGALQAMVHLEGLAPFCRPIIVGTELVSFSAILTCRKPGIRPVAMLEPGPRVTAWPICAFYPAMLGIPLHRGAAITAINGGSRVESVDVRMADGSERRLTCDGVLFTGRFVPETALLRAGGIELDPGTQGPVVDQFGRTSDPAVFAAGNLLRPVETAGWCREEGRQVGTMIARDLKEALPDPARAVPLSVAAPLRLVVPHNLLPGPLGLGCLQLRAAARAKGELEITTRGRVLLRRRIDLLPERRFTIPIEALGPLDGLERICLSIVDPLDAARATPLHVPARTLAQPEEKP